MQALLITPKYFLTIAGGIKYTHFQQSTRTIRLRKNAKAEGGEPTYKDVKLEEIQTRRR